MSSKEITYAENENGCWICTSHGLNTHGYPKMSINKKQVLIHRYQYELHNGPINNNYVIRHTCDNKLCINPKHLLQGTHKDNVSDRVMRDRSARGSDNGRSKLTENQVYNIRYNLNHLTMQALSEMFLVDRKVIYNIRKNKSWIHI
jgi:hypothetical protein